MILDGDWLNAPVPDIDAPRAEALVLERFGIQATASDLYAERDRNFRMDGPDGRRYVFKVANQDSTRNSLEFQNRVLDHLAKTDPGLPAPRVQNSLEGEEIEWWEARDGTHHMIRLLSWLDGELIRLRHAPSKSRTAQGAFLARLQKALENCSSDGAPRDLPWDLKSFPSLRSLAETPSAREVKQLVLKRFQAFEQAREGVLSTLPGQLIHNDLNEGNIVFEKNKPEVVSGIIDFGDMVEGPIVHDLAVACAYQLSGEGDPLDELAPFVRGFLSVQSLSRDELRVLKLLTECRLTTTLLIQGWRVDNNMDDDGELAIDAAEAAERLQLMDQVPIESFVGAVALPGEA